MQTTIETKEQMTKRHGDEFSALPVFWAFSNEQFSEGIEKMRNDGRLGESEKVVRIGGGGFIAEHAVQEMLDLLERQDKETKGLLSNYESAKAAFKYEMWNHEYPINWQGDWDVINCFCKVEYEDAETGWYLAQTDWSDEIKRAYLDAAHEVRTEGDW